MGDCDSGFRVWGMGARVSGGRPFTKPARQLCLPDLQAVSSKRRGDTLKRLKDLYLNAKARVWP